MKQMKYLMAATALAVLASCSSESDIAESVQVQAPQAVTFGAYQAQSTVTRGEISGVADFASTGFGVFAYYTNTADYAGSTTPNFMYNQKVTGDNSSGSYVWSYTPLKYWPNDIAENGDIDGQGAKGSVAGGKVSFFAYAPYNDSYTFSGANDTGNPKVTFTADGTDLLWGTAGTNSVGFVNADEGTQEGKVIGSGLAKVWADIIRPKATDVIKFNFRHALAKFGGNGSASAGIRIKLNPDDSGTGTKVTVRSITIANADEGNASEAFATAGTLDLATGLWSSTSGTQTVSYELTKANGKLNNQITEKTAAIGDDLVGSSGEPYATADAFFNDTNLPGVTTDAIDVFADTQSPIFFVPGTTPKVKVTVSYVVRTSDDKLDKKFTEVEQTVTKTITFDTTELNKAYGLLISLGLTSVKFDVTATVDAWTDVNASSGATSGKVDLPANE